MSFILDALRKSEHERQRQGGPGIADLKPTVTAARLPGWAIALGALLLVNIIVVLVLVLRGPSPSREAQVAPAAAQTPPPAPAPATTEPATQPAPAPAYALPPPVLSRAPAQYETEVSTPRAYAPAQRAYEEAPRGPDPQLDAQESTENLPLMNDIGSGRAPELHLDLHVYSSRAADRFVFLNGRKYREGGETPEGTRIERITADGVVLNHRGLRFLMPRQ